MLNRIQSAVAGGDFLGERFRFFEKASETVVLVGQTGCIFDEPRLPFDEAGSPTITTRQPLQLRTIRVLLKDGERAKRFDRRVTPGYVADVSSGSEDAGLLAISAPFAFFAPAEPALISRLPDAVDAKPAKKGREESEPKHRKRSSPNAE